MSDLDHIWHVWINRRQHERGKEAAETEKREANKKHRAKIHREAAAQLRAALEDIPASIPGCNCRCVEFNLPTLTIEELP